MRMMRIFSCFAGAVIVVTLTAGCVLGNTPNFWVVNGTDIVDAQSADVDLQIHVRPAMMRQLKAPLASCHYSDFSCMQQGIMHLYGQNYDFGVAPEHHANVSRLWQTALARAIYQIGVQREVVDLARILWGYSDESGRCLVVERVPIGADPNQHFTPIPHLTTCR